MTDVADNIKGDAVHEKDDHLESDFFRSARLARDKLDTISPSMCLAKWSQVSLHHRDTSNQDSSETNQNRLQRWV